MTTRNAKCKPISGVAAVCAAPLVGSIAMAQENDRIVIPYGCVGSASGDDVSESDVTPWSIGGYASTASKVMLGLGFTQEGISFDWTARRGGSIRQVHSFNFLLGRNLVQREDFNLDAALLMGANETKATCPFGQSVLGFRCWANYDPQSDYEINYGVLLTITVQSVVLGIRAAEESVQGVIGWRS